MNNLDQKSNYYKHLIAQAQAQGGEFETALIDIVAKECLATVKDITQEIPGDEKWSPLGVAESIELRIAALFCIDLTGESHEQSSQDSSIVEQSK